MKQFCQLVATPVDVFDHLAEAVGVLIVFFFILLGEYIVDGGIELFNELLVVSHNLCYQVFFFKLNYFTVSNHIWKFSFHQQKALMTHHHTDC